MTLLNHTIIGWKVNFLKLIIGYFVLAVLYLLLKYTADCLLEDPPNRTGKSYVYIGAFAPRNIIRGLNFTILGTFYWSASHISYFHKKFQQSENKKLAIEKTNAELETQLAKTHNAYLQQQINPHMLFNALNFVYNNTQKYSEDAAHCIWLLSEIMRFSLEEAGSDGKIKLAREVEQIENLVAINRYRFREPLYLSVEIGNDLNSYKIIPLILLTLTENIFKHGNLTDPKSPAKIQLSTDETGKLTFHSLNLKKSKNGHARERKALGLQNIRLRLDSFYKDNYTLQINEPGEYYELTLTLRL
ncbi:sensor histidine kinase [Pedobacter sp. KBS0701]|uniref:sensor histidine kinase n=1 Tax=Pedobacter sp. KBS0701 TaxID=2578106 RepID=UPI00143CEF3C|nr:histidine kinase [Pedobacter sp. KBS0701]